MKNKFKIAEFYPRKYRKGLQDLCEYYYNLFSGISVTNQDCNMFERLFTNESSMKEVWHFVESKDDVIDPIKFYEMVCEHLASILIASGAKLKVLESKLNRVEELIVEFYDEISLKNTDPIIKYHWEIILNDLLLGHQVISLTDEKFLKSFFLNKNTSKSSDILSEMLRILKNFQFARLRIEFLRRIEIGFQKRSKKNTSKGVLIKVLSDLVLKTYRKPLYKITTDLVSAILDEEINYDDVRKLLNPPKLSNKRKIQRKK